MIVVAVVPSCLCVSVRFPSQQTVYVVSGENLVLQAEFELPQGDRITKVTWEHEVKEQTISGKSMLAEYPAKSSEGRVTVDKGGAVMTLRDYQRADNGVYTVTVQDQIRGQSSAHCTVHEYGMKFHIFKSVSQAVYTSLSHPS